MPSLREILSAHAPVLLLDAASSRTQIGWFPSAIPEDSRWAASDEESGVGVFRCLEQLGLNPNNARALVFCEGPGSVLGIRTTAMAVRTWQVSANRPAFAYCSLAVVAHAAESDCVGVIADARRDQWHYFQLSSSLRRVPTEQLSGALVMPENFRHWSLLPAQVSRTSYSLAEMFPRVADVDLFQARTEPDAFLHQEPSYVTWTPQIHRAPD